MVVLTPHKKALVIERIVCDYFGLTKEEMHQKTRKKDIIRPRQIFHYLACNYSKISQEKIGAIHGVEKLILDHTSVFHSKKTITNELEYNKDLIKDINNLEFLVKEGIKPKKSKEYLSFRSKIIQAMKRAENEEILRCEVMNLL